MSYTLVAQLPSNGLKHCIRLLPRPPWEPKIRNAAIILLLITFIFVIVAVHFDYDNIIYKQSVLYQAREKGTVHPTFNLRNIAMRSTLQNNENSLRNNECNTRGGKTKLNTVEKLDNTNSTTNLKRRNVKNSKATNNDSKPVMTNSRKPMSLAYMVNWTFGSKNSKKSLANNKNCKGSGNQTNENAGAAAAAIQATNNDLKTCKPRLSERSLIDKMDSDLKKSQTSKRYKPTTSEKVNNKIMDKTEDDGKRKTDENINKEMKKDKNSPKLNDKSNVSLNNSVDANTSAKATKERRKSIDFTSQETYYEDNATSTPEKIQSPPKESNVTNGRKIAKTPGRERRKQSAQRSSPTTSDTTNFSCSSSTSSSCSSNHNAAKRQDRKHKVKAINCLKFNNNVNNVNNMFPSTSSSSSATSVTSKRHKKESRNSHLDILTPWNSTSQVTFSDVLQNPQPSSQSYANETSENDLVQQEALFSDIFSDAHIVGVENKEKAAASTPKKSKNSVTDLGPIGSRKSPSSTPVWEPVQSAITMQLPRPINASSTTTANPSSTSTFYSMNSNFGYNNLATSSTSALTSGLQQQQDIQAQLLVLQHQLLEQKHLQQQQQQQYLNSNWSSSLWGPIPNNTSTTAHGSSSTIFNQTTSMQSPTWSLSTPSTATPSSAVGVVRPPPGLEQNFVLTTNGMNSHHPSLAAASTSSNLSATFNNTMTASISNSNDNMPMFNLFSGLSSIWDDNWQNSTNQQQQEEQQQHQQQQPLP